MVQKPNPQKFSSDSPLNLFRRTRPRKGLLGKLYNPQLVVQLLICTFIILLHMGLLFTPALERFEYIFLDVFFRFRSSETLTSFRGITYVEIAEDSIQAIGRWPWPRQYHATITHILSEWGAEAIVFDVLFSEKSNVFDDGALRESFEEADNIYLPVALERQGERQIWIHSLPELEELAKGYGHINITPDMDGTVRRVKPFLDYGGYQYPHLALQVAYDLLGRSLDSEKDLTFPLDPQGEWLINWAGKWRDTFEHISFVDLIKSYQQVREGKRPLISPNLVKDKICLIGLTAFGHADIKANPSEPAYPAVGIHANIINSILTQSFVRSASSWLNILCLLFVGLTVSFFFANFRNIFSVVFGLVFACIWVVSSFFVFSKWGVFVTNMHAIMLILALYIFSSTYALFIRKQEMQNLFQLSTRDGLTGLFVIRHFRGVLNREVSRASKQKTPLSVILLDIDHFKKINDTYGHPAGDKVLKETARVLDRIGSQATTNRDSITVGRYGGEEFILLLRNFDLETATYSIAERIRKTVEERIFEWENIRIFVTVSLGVSTLHKGESIPDLLVRRADAALYHAKENGRNQSCQEAPFEKG